MNKLTKISDLFTIKYGSNLELINLEQCKSTDRNSIPFVSRTEKNNGVSAFVEEELDVEKEASHTLTVAVGGSVLSTFYQPIPFYTGFHVLVLAPKIKMTIEEMLFYAKCISLNKYKYSYGRQANKTLKDVLIPRIPPKSIIKKLSQYKSALEEKIKPYPLIHKKIAINDSNWIYFPLVNLFEILGSKTTPKQELEEIGRGQFPNVTTQATHNGVDEFYDFYTETGNVLTIESAVLGHCAYQAFNFSASDHVEKLVPKFEMNVYIATFFVALLNLEKYRYNYGRKSSQSRLKKTFIQLPSKDTINPDFKFMENYIKSLSYSSNL